MSLERKSIAQNFLTLVGTGEVVKAYNQHVSSDFIHHNQYFKGDRESLRLAMIDAHKENPNQSVDVKTTFAEGDFIICHSHIVNDKMQIAVVHIFRFVGSKIVELWDLGQVIEPEGVN